MPSWSPLSRRSIPAFKERDGSSRSTTSTLKDSKEEQLVSSLHSKASHSSHLQLPPRPPLQGRGNQFHPGVNHSILINTKNEQKHIFRMQTPVPSLQSPSLPRGRRIRPPPNADPRFPFKIASLPALLCFSYFSLWF